MRRGDRLPHVDYHGGGGVPHDGRIGYFDGTAIADGAGGIACLAVKFAVDFIPKAGFAAHEVAGACWKGVWTQGGAARWIDGSDASGALFEPVARKRRRAAVPTLV